MSMRFLHIKRAHVINPTYTFEVDRDVALNISLLDRVYAEVDMHDICAITEDGEWLIQGRKIDPTVMLQLYTTVFVYIHSPSDVYDRAAHACKAYAQKHVLIYKATDTVLHHTARLEALIKTNALKAKMAHQVHVDMTEYNENFISSEVVAGKHIRNIFLPVQVIPTVYRTHTPEGHTYLLAHNHEELAEHIDTLRHVNTHITLRSHLTGDSVFVATIPHIRGEKIYTTMPLLSKDIKGIIHFQEFHAPSLVKKEIYEVVSDISNVLFPKSSLVYTLRIHGKRGVFIHATSPFYFFIIHNPDYLFELAHTHGMRVEELFQTVL